jgi:hypothetical protein
MLEHLLRTTLSGSRVLDESSMPDRKVIFLLADRSPIRPREVRGKQASGDKKLYDGMISALNVLRFIDYCRLRRKRSRRELPLSANEKLDFGRGGNWRFLGAYPSEEWLSCLRPDSFLMLRIKCLIEALEIRTRDRWGSGDILRRLPLTCRLPSVQARETIQTGYLSRPSLGDWGVRTRQLAEQLGL